MPNAYTGRVLLILAVLYGALCCVYPKAAFSVFQLAIDEPVSMEVNLRPGIDMVGGTSLVYEIERPADAPPRGAGGESLSQQVASALKRRVDPQGVLNLVWRPQGDERLEIQLPLSGDSAQADEARSAYQAAQQSLTDLVVRPDQVVGVIEQYEDADRTERLSELAGSQTRLATYEQAAQAFDALEAARSSGVVIRIADAEAAYEQAKQDLRDTNITVEQVETVSTLEPDVRQERLDAIMALNGDDAKRAKAIEDYLAAAEQYASLRDKIADTATLKRLLQGSGVLQFNILPFVVSDSGASGFDDGLTPEIFEQKAAELARVGARPAAGDDFRWIEAEDGATLSPNMTRVGPDGKTYVLAWNTEPKTLDQRDGEWGLEQARRSQDERGGNAIGFTLDAAGAALFGDLSGSNIGRPLAIVLDDRVISAPTLQGRISSQGQITGGRGGFAADEQAYLVNTLNAGALPARLSDEPISERTIGPQLGKDNLRAGFSASIAGLVIVGVFLIGYYYLAGTVAFGAVLMNMLIILASMAALQATFTLPSVAGIILSLGMSVDANVLIFERLREEQARGLSLRMALRNGYDRALSAILDSNITTGITALILYVFGSEEVKGFGLTLLIGIFASLFTALFVTKTIFGLLVDKLDLKDLSSLPRTFPKWNKFLTPDIDWMKRAWLFGGVSGIIILIGCILFGVYFAKGRVLDTEFAGGTTAVFNLKDPMSTADVREALGRSEATDALTGLQVVSIEPSAGTADNTKYEIVTNNTDDAEVTAAILARLGERIDSRQPSTFNGYDQPYESVAGTAAVPVDDNADVAIGLPVEERLIAANEGGIAIVLRNLEPMPSQTELRDRIVGQRLKGQYNAQGLRGGVNIDVETFAGEDAAVVFVANERYGYDEDPDLERAFNTELAAPAWQMVVDAVAEPEELERVTKIGAQVAGEFKRDAALAVILSVLAIMGYIWLRFGDLKYSTATVVALAHDTLFVLAGIGYAHLLAETFIGDAFLLDPFRLNLTMVAAILTVMGFSMNDTVVVFDRIRENRGKYGTLTHKVINDSINQTLSRTLLTGGTTLVTIFVMYAFGGPGIHGFTFAMLVGIITGTYSSIAIASPLLLVGPRNDEEESPAPATSSVATA